MLGRHTVTITMYVASFDRSRLPVSQDNDGSHSALSFLAQPPQPRETITGATAHTLLIASAAPQDQRSGDARQAFLEQGRLLTTRHVPRGGHLAHVRPSSSWWAPKDIVLGAAADSSSPAPFMSRMFAESLGRQRRGCSCIFRCFLGVEGGFSDGYGE